MRDESFVCKTGRYCIVCKTFTAEERYTKKIDAEVCGKCSDEISELLKNGFYVTADGYIPAEPIEEEKKS